MLQRCLAFCAALVLWLAPTAGSAEGPEWRPLIDSWVEALNASDDSIDLSIDGLTLSEESGASTLASFDGLAMTFGKSGRAETGPGSLQFEADDDGNITFGSLELSEPITLRGRPQDNRVTLTFELRRLDGTWNEGHELFSHLDLLIEDLLARKTQGEEPVAIRRLSAESLVTPLDGSRYDQSASIAAQGLKIETPDGGLALDRLVLQLESHENDIDAIQAWAERLEAAELGRSRDNLPPIGSLWRDNHVVFLMAGMLAEDKSDQQVIWLEDLRIETGIARGEELGHLTLSFLLEGVGLDLEGSADPDLARAAGLTPSHLRLPLVAEGVPDQALGRLILDLASQEKSRKGPVIDPDGKVDMMPFFRSLGRAGARLIFDDLLISGPAGSLAGGGALTLAPQLPFGVFGEVSLSLGGVEEAEEALRAADDPDAAKIAFLFSTFLKGLGSPEVGPDGALVYRYDLQLGEDGSALLNTLPLDGLLDR